MSRKYQNPNITKPHYTPKGAEEVVQAKVSGCFFYTVWLIALAAFLVLLFRLSL